MGLVAVIRVDCDSVTETLEGDCRIDDQAFGTTDAEVGMEENDASRFGWRFRWRCGHDGRSRLLENDTSFGWRKRSVESENDSHAIYSLLYTVNLRRLIAVVRSTLIYGAWYA